MPDTNEWLEANGPGGWIDELRKDAERYRWLRKRINWRDEPSKAGTFSTRYRSWEHRDFRDNPPAREHIDEYIDAEMKQSY